MTGGLERLFWFCGAWKCPWGCRKDPTRIQDAHLEFFAYAPAAPCRIQDSADFVALKSRSWKRVTNLISCGKVRRCLPRLQKCQRACGAGEPSLTAAVVYHRPKPVYSPVSTPGSMLAIVMTSAQISSIF